MPAQKGLFNFLSAACNRYSYAEDVALVDLAIREEFDFTFYGDCFFKAAA